MANKAHNILKNQAGEHQAGMRLRDFLRNTMDLSNRNIKRLAMGRNIFVNQRTARLNTILKAGDIVHVQLDQEEHQNMAAIPMDLTIVYEDEALLVVDKPANLVVHPTKKHIDDTLTNGVLYHFKENNDPSIVRLVSRLDMNTSGLVLIAKNQFVHSHFSRRPQDISKKYLGITQGHWEKKEGLLDFPIYLPGPEAIARVIDDQGQPSQTKYRVLGQGRTLDLVEFELLTGRTHQIRLHASHSGHPLVGDELYGGPLAEYQRQLLHAYALTFVHPMTKETLSLRACLPKDMTNCLTAQGLSWQEPSWVK